MTEMMKRVTKLEEKANNYAMRQGSAENEIDMLTGKVTDLTTKGKEKDQKIGELEETIRNMRKDMEIMELKVVRVEEKDSEKKDKEGKG